MRLRNHLMRASKPLRDNVSMPNFHCDISILRYSRGDENAASDQLVNKMRYFIYIYIFMYSSRRYRAGQQP